MKNLIAKFLSWLLFKKKTPTVELTVNVYLFNISKD